MVVEVIIDRLRHLNALELLALLGAIVAEFQDRMQIPAEVAAAMQPPEDDRLRTFSKC